ncbi:hypothetical protein J1N35_028376 [Gossypium stocksii]|uniref:Uncharacterized protein n=1 Tax=Gossypium stocksii TaxID=47602 RepID=A0A9D3UWK1_9ROSI|nr:hypothetical protein J1N35_028376 [Gossypium stocksii]
MEMADKEAEAESISKVSKMGKADGADKCLSWALEEVRDMGLAVVEDLVEATKDRGMDNGSSMDVGYRKIDKTNSEVKTNSEEGNNSDQEIESERDTFLEVNLDLEKEFNQIFLHKKKKKALNKKIRSVYEIQNSSLTVKERKKRDRALQKEKGKEFRKDDERIANLSLSDSDISFRMRVILR